MTTQSLKEDGRPSQQWYWDDWFSEFGLRVCSLAARGLWMDMLGIMFKAEIRGTLTINGKQIDNKHLAKIVGDTEGNIKIFLKELEDNDVYSNLKDGTIVCRRMLNESKRKEEISRIRSNAGKMGAKKRWSKNGKKNGKTVKKIAKSPRESMAKMASPSSSPTPTATSSSKNIVLETEFQKLWKSYPKEGRFDSKESLKKFKAICGQGKLKAFKKVPNGYLQFLEHKKNNENFPQKAKHLKTWLNNWEGEREQFENFKYESPL